MPLTTQEQEVYLQNTFKMIPSITNSIQQRKASSKDFDAAGSIFEEDNADERSHVSEQVCDVVYVFHNVSFHCLFCSIFDTYVA